MLINPDEAEKRLSNPNNLINRLSSLSNGTDKRKNAMSLFVPSVIQKKEIVSPQEKSSEETVTFNPFHKPASNSTPNSEAAPNSDDLIEDVETKIELATAHDNAIKLMNEGINSLRDRLENVKADKLPSVISAASKVVESIRRERTERDKNGSKDQDVHLHFYCPEPRPIEHYEVIEVEQ